MSTLHVENLKGLSSGGNANKIIVPSGQTLDASNGFIAPAGHVIQMQTAQLAGNGNQSTSTSYVDTGLTVNITPKFATSKIIVFINQQIGKTRSSTGVARIDTKLIESNSNTILAQSRFEGTDNLASGNLSSYTSQHGVFQCSNTNQLTFTTQARPASGSSSSAAAVFHSWYTDAVHNITAMEIAQ